jgi:acyl-CoA thioesterase
VIDRDRDPVGYAREVVGGDPFARHLGIRVEEARESYARTSLKIRQEYCNSAARSHGGVLFSLADQALAVAANSKGYLGFALEIKINYFAAAYAGEIIYAEATPIDIRKRISLWNIELTNEKGERIAVAHGMAYHFV